MTVIINSKPFHNCRFNKENLVKFIAILLGHYITQRSKVLKKRAVKVMNELLSLAFMLLSREQSCVEGSSSLIDMTREQLEYVSKFLPEFFIFVFGSDSFGGIKKEYQVELEACSLDRPDPLNCFYSVLLSLI